MRRTVADSYLEPSAQAIKATAEKHGVKGWNNDFVLDMCNYAAGGKFIDEYEYRSSLTPSPYNPDRWYSQKDYEDDVEDFYRIEMRRFERVKNFIENVGVRGIEGTSPLDKTMKLLSMLSKTDNSYADDSDEGMPLVSCENEEDQREFRKFLDEFQYLPKEDKNLLKNFKLDNGVYQEFTKINSRVNKIVKMKAHKSSKIVSDRSGSQTRLRVISDPSEIVRTTPDFWAMSKPLQAYKIATRQALVKERVSKEEKKQFLYLMIDASGSMSREEKCGAAMAILINRVKAVIRGDAKLIVAYFNNSLGKSRIIDNAHDAQTFIDEISSKKFANGGTHTGQCILEAVQDINDKMANDPQFEACDRPELCVVTDEDDSIDIQHKDMDGIKLHAFVVGGSANQKLMTLAKSTGGVAMQI